MLAVKQDQVKTKAESLNQFLVNLTWEDRFGNVEKIS